MELYHSTNKKEKIIEENKLKVNKTFNYRKYLEYVLSIVKQFENKPEKLVGNYPGSRTQSPFMGQGIYCFDNYEDAINYQSQSQVVTIDFDNVSIILDLDDPMVLLDVLAALEEVDRKIDSEIKEEDIKYKWHLLCEILIASLYEEFENSQPAVGLILKVFDWFKVNFNSSPDLIVRSFYDKIASDSSDDISKNKYYLIKNSNKIKSIC
ncbi:hypothetical protein ACWOEC_10825 [Enterococcus bulliens]